VFRVFLAVAPVVYVGMIAALLATLASGSQLSFVRFGFGFLTSAAWNPITGNFGALAFIFGTVVSSLLALLFATPVGIFSAIFLAEFATPEVGGVLGLLIEMLAAVPSVVYGLWGLFVLAPFMQDQLDPILQRLFGFTPLFSGMYYGVGMLTAAVMLAIMILPTITAITRDVILAVPNDQRDGSIALGATRWETIWRVTIPHAGAGIFGAIVLALGRAVGETIATTMVIGNRPVISASLFAPSYTLASVIANEFTEATSAIHTSSLIELGFVLVLISALVNVFARLLLWRMKRYEPQ
jgi:phosphate transport system permease protein